MDDFSSELWRPQSSDAFVVVKPKLDSGTLAPQMHGERHCCPTSHLRCLVGTNALFADYHLPPAPMPKNVDDRLFHRVIPRLLFGGSAQHSHAPHNKLAIADGARFDSSATFQSHHTRLRWPHDGARHHSPGRPRAFLASLFDKRAARISRQRNCKGHYTYPASRMLAARSYIF